MTYEERILKLENEIAELKAEITKKNESESIYVPKKWENYIAVLGNGEISKYTNADIGDQYYMDMNNYFTPTKETEKHLEWYRDNVIKVQNKLMQLHELLCPDYFPDWKNNECKFYICLNYYYNEWQYAHNIACNDIHVFFDEESAKKACEILNREKFMIE